MVDRDDPSELADALGRLLTDRAWERARADFDVADARARFEATLSG